MRKVFCGLLCATFFAESVFNPISTYATTSKANTMIASKDSKKDATEANGEWKMHETRDKNGRAYKVQYFYPESAKKYGIPENAFWKEGASTKVARKIGQYSYVVITKVDPNEHPKNVACDKKVHSAFVVYEKKHETIQAIKNAGFLGKGKASLRIVAMDGNIKAHVEASPSVIGGKAPMINLGIGRLAKIISQHLPTTQTYLRVRQLLLVQVEHQQVILH